MFDSIEMWALMTCDCKAIQTHVRSLQAFDDEEDSDYSGSLESISESDEPKSDEDGSSSESDKSFKDSKPPARRSLLFHNIPSAKRKSKDTNYVSFSLVNT